MDKSYSDLIDTYTKISTKEWIPLIDIRKEESLEGINDIFLFSALIENKESKIAEYLKVPTWEFSSDSFGKSTFYKTNDEIHYAAGDKVNDIEYIVTYRTFNKFDPVIEINPKLIWYGNLIYKNSEFIDSDSYKSLIKIYDSSVLIEREYLRDYLAANDKVLAIYFDNRRYYKEDTRMEYFSKDYKGSSYNINFSKSSGEYQENNAYSFLLGKTLLKPLSQPSHEDYKYFFEIDEYEEFIIGMDTDEKPIVFTCQEDKLANFFGANPKAPNFLTPVYFNRNVLEKYHNNPDDYDVQDGNVSYLNKWSIPFTINKEDFVVVWLGDLGRIPYSEQKYWKLYNEKPEGGIEDKFFERQILAKWSETILPEREIFHLIDRINLIIESRYGDKLFEELGDADNKLESAFSIPANSSVTRYQNFLMQLNKITVERINTKLIKENVKEELLKDEKNDTFFGSRVQLRIFLEELGIKSAEKLDNALKLSYNSRNKLAGHKGSIKGYNKVWKRDVEYKPDFISDSKILLTGINIALDHIYEELQNDSE